MKEVKKMARNDGKDRTVARNTPRTAKNILSAEMHNERKNESYMNPDIVQERSGMNIHFKEPTGGYMEMFSQMEQDGIISTRGLKKDANLFGEMVFDVNSAYFHNRGGYEFAKDFYTEAYKAAVKIVGGEQYILSAVMHADEQNQGMTRALGYPVWHYHLHVVYIPVVEKQILWSKRCKDPALIGTVKETIHQVSHSKKWTSAPVLDENGNPLKTKTGRVVLRKSYSVLQDQYHEHMVNAGFTDVERGERGNDEERLTTTQFKIMKEEAHLEQLTVQQHAAEQARMDAEKARTEIEQTVKEAEQQLHITEKAAQKTLDYAQKLGDAETLLEKPGRLESAKSVYTRAVTVLHTLIGKIKHLYTMYLNERTKNEKLVRENRILADRANEAKVSIDKAYRFERLEKILGIEEINRLLKERIPRKQEKHNMKEVIR